MKGIIINLKEPRDDIEYIYPDFGNQFLEFNKDIDPQFSEGVIDELYNTILV